MPKLDLSDYFPPNYYELRVDVARLEKNDQRWSIWLAPEATVVELALLMGGIPCKLEAHNMGEGAFALIPVEPHSPCPTGAQLAALFEKGLGTKLPSLRQVDVNGCTCNFAWYGEHASWCFLAPTRLQD